jgi:NAD dependent epimerase/dehydratase family enzyme
MRIVISGGTGFIGRALCVSLCHDGHQVSVLTRNKETAHRTCDPKVTAIEWNGREAATLASCLEGADAVINLAGAPIATGVGPMPANSSSRTAESSPLDQWWTPSRAVHQNLVR